MLILLLPNLLLGLYSFKRFSIVLLILLLYLSSLQIIATRNHPCCECVKYPDNRTPVCLLFLIFLVCSSVVITGVMYYLKSGIVHFLLFSDTLSITIVFPQIRLQLSRYQQLPIEMTSMPNPRVSPEAEEERILGFYLCFICFLFLAFIVQCTFNCSLNIVVELSSSSAGTTAQCTRPKINDHLYLTKMTYDTKNTYNSQL